MSCGATKSAGGVTVVCVKKDGHYRGTAASAHRSAWIETTFVQRFATGIDRIRVEWVGQ